MHVAGHQQWNSNIVFRFFPDEKKLIVLSKMEFLEWLFSLGKCSQNIRHLALSSWKTDEKKAKNWCIPALIRKMKIGLIALERHLERGCSMMDSGALHRSSPSGKPKSLLKQFGAGHYVWPLGWLRYGVWFFFYSSATRWKMFKDIAPQQGFSAAPHIFLQIQIYSQCTEKEIFVGMA